MHVKVQYNNKRANLDLYVVRKEGRSLFGRESFVFLLTLYMPLISDSSSSLSPSKCSFRVSDIFFPLHAFLMCPVFLYLPTIYTPILTDNHQILLTMDT
jgi:hypothetical protein